jgi:hypothetical protein
MDNNTTNVFGKYQIELVDVKPYPVNTIPIKNEDYTAVLRITKIIQLDALSPMKQLEYGILINDIECKNDIHVLAKRPNDKIACIYETTAEKLGWKIINSEISEKSVFEVTKNDVLFDVDYSIKGGLVKDMTFVERTNSLSVKIDSFAVGDLTLEIPRGLIDAKFDYCSPRHENPPDEIFFVLLDSEEIHYDEITTTESRILKIHFFEDKSKIEVITTCLI